MTLPVCVGEHLTITPEGLLRMAPWSVPRNVVDVKIPSGGDTRSLLMTDQLPGRLMMDKKVEYVNYTPIDLDNRILLAERNALLGGDHHWEVENHYWPLDVRIVGLAPLDAEHAFLATAEKLGIK